MPRPPMRYGDAPIEPRLRTALAIAEAIRVVAPPPFASKLLKPPSNRAPTGMSGAPMATPTLMLYPELLASPRSLMGTDRPPETRMDALCAREMAGVANSAPAARTARSRRDMLIPPGRLDGAEGGISSTVPRSRERAYDDPSIPPARTAPRVSLPEY